MSLITEPTLYHVSNCFAIASMVRTAEPMYTSSTADSCPPSLLFTGLAEGANHVQVTSTLSGY